MRVFVFPVLIKDNNSNNYCKNHCNTKSDVISHIYSPLSKITPTIINIIQKVTPKVILGISNSFEMKEPKITIAKIKFAELKNALDKFLRCRLVNFINDIISQLKTLVKQKYISILN